MGKIRTPTTAKILGFNIAPKLSYGTARPFENLFIEWDWDGWIKKQIDYCAGNNIGLNACRLIGGQMGVVDGMYTQSYYDSRMTQLVEYCRSLGIYYYATGFGKSAYNAIAPATSMSVVAATLSTTLRVLQAYPNVIGCDVIQEANGAYNPSDASLIELLGLLRGSGVTLPLTCSTAEINVSSAATAPWLYAMAGNFDFIDIHNYTYPVTMQAFDVVLAAFPDKDILMGEFGRAQNIAEASRLVDLRQMLDLANSGNPRLRGAVFWAATDQDTVSSNQWGLYPTTFTVRSEQTQLLLRRYTGGSVAALNQKQF